MKNRITAVGIIRIGYGAMGLLTALIVAGILIGSGLIAQANGDRQALPILTAIAVFVGLLVGGLSVLHVVGGWGLLKRQKWARYLVMVLSVMDLLNIPIGTALGVYSLWVLLQTDVEAVFAGEPAEG